MPASSPAAGEPGHPGRTRPRTLIGDRLRSTYRRCLTDARHARHDAANRAAVVPWASLGEHTEVWALWNGRHHRSPPTAPASAVAGTRRVRQSANTPHRLRPVRPLANLRRVHGGRAQPPPAPPATPSRSGPAHLSLHMRALLAQDTLNGLYTLGYFQALPSAITVFQAFQSFFHAAP